MSKGGRRNPRRRDPRRRIDPLGGPAAGLWLPADCQQGWCITCAAKLVDGEVDHGAAKRYYEEDSTADFVLPCVDRPRSDVHVEAAKYDEMLRHRADDYRPPGRSKLG